MLALKYVKVSAAFVAVGAEAMLHRVAPQDHQSDQIVEKEDDAEMQDVTHDWGVIKCIGNKSIFEGEKPMETYIRNARDPYQKPAIRKTTSITKVENEREMGRDDDRSRKNRLASREDDEANHYRQRSRSRSTESRKRTTSENGIRRRKKRTEDSGLPLQKSSLPSSSDNEDLNESSEENLNESSEEDSNGSDMSEEPDTDDDMEFGDFLDYHGFVDFSASEDEMIEWVYKNLNFARRRGVVAEAIHPYDDQELVLMVAPKCGKCNSSPAEGCPKFCTAKVNRPDLMFHLVKNNVPELDAGTPAERKIKNERYEWIKRRLFEEQEIFDELFVGRANYVSSDALLKSIVDESKGESFLQIPGGAKFQPTDHENAVLANMPRYMTKIVMTREVVLKTGRKFLIRVAETAPKQLETMWSDDCNQVYELKNLNRKEQDHALEESRYEESDLNVKFIIRDLLEICEFFHAHNVVLRNLHRTTIGFVRSKNEVGGRNWRVAIAVHTQEMRKLYVDLATGEATGIRNASLIDERMPGTVGHSESTPPETWKPNGAHGKKGDVFAVGSILYLFLCVDMPHHFETDELKELQHEKRMNSYRKSLSEMRQDWEVCRLTAYAVLTGQLKDALADNNLRMAKLSAPTKNFLECALAISPDERYASTKLLKHPWLSGSAYYEDDWKVDHQVQYVDANDKFEVELEIEIVNEDESENDDELNDENDDASNDENDDEMQGQIVERHQEDQVGEKDQVLHSLQALNIQEAQVQPRLSYNNEQKALKHVTCNTCNKEKLWVFESYQLPAKVTDKYEFRQHIGTGHNESAVWLAKLKYTGTEVAVKVLETGVKKGCRKNNEKEINAEVNLYWHLPKNTHIIDFKNIINVEKNGNVPSYSLLVMEYAKQGPLSNYNLFKNNADNEQGIGKIVRQLLRGVHAMHSANIVHQDIKPDNILVDGMGNCKLADLGLSTDVLGCRKPPYSRGGGTVPFMAPELYEQGRAQYSSKVDIFAIGVTMWQLLFESFLPHFYEAQIDKSLRFEEVHAAMKRKLNPEFLQKWTAFAHLSPNLKDALMKMICFDDNERWSAKQLLQHTFFTELETNPYHRSINKKKPSVAVRPIRKQRSIFELTKSIRHPVGEKLNVNTNMWENMMIGFENHGFGQANNLLLSSKPCGFQKQILQGAALQNSNGLRKQESQLLFNNNRDQAFGQIQSGRMLQQRGVNNPDELTILKQPEQQFEHDNSKLLLNLKKSDTKRQPQLSSLGNDGFFGQVQGAYKLRGSKNNMQLFGDAHQLENNNFGVPNHNIGGLDDLLERPNYAAPQMGMVPQLESIGMGNEKIQQIENGQEINIREEEDPIFGGGMPDFGGQNNMSNLGSI